MWNNKTKKIGNSILGVLGMMALFQTLSIPADATKSYVATTNSFLGMWVCILSAILYCKVADKIPQLKKMQTIIGLFYSLALAFALTAGKQLETVEFSTLIN